MDLTTKFPVPELGSNECKKLHTNELVEFGLWCRHKNVPLTDPVICCSCKYNTQAMGSGFDNQGAN